MSFYDSLDDNNKSFYMALEKLKSVLNAREFKLGDVAESMKALAMERGKQLLENSTPQQQEEKIFKTEAIRRVESAFLKLNEKPLFSSTNMEQKKAIMRIAIAQLQKGLGKEAADARIFEKNLFKSGQLKNRDVGGLGRIPAIRLPNKTPQFLRSLANEQLNAENPTESQPRRGKPKSP